MVEFFLLVDRIGRFEAWPFLFNCTKILYFSTLDYYFLGGYILIYFLIRIQHIQQVLTFFCVYFLSEKEDGAKVKRVSNLNNPYMKNQNPNWRFRLSLNKLYAWNLVEYDRVVMLDADNLFLKKTDELFQCGQFCAVFINPCIFHTGLFVLQVYTYIYIYE